jgi:hypothetical protein
LECNLAVKFGFDLLIVFVLKLTSIFYTYLKCLSSKCF